MGHVREIIDTVAGLSGIAEQNAASTQETYAQTAEVSQNFAQIEKHAVHLKAIADNLSETTEYFRL